MFSIGDQIEIISEAHNLGQTLEDVDAEALAAFFDVSSSSFGGITVGEEINYSNIYPERAQETLLFRLTEFTSRSLSDPSRYET